MTRACRGYDLQITDYDMHRCQLVMYMGCNSGVVDPVFGDLIGATVAQGARAVIGFTEPLGLDNLYANAFFHEACALRTSLRDAHQADLAAQYAYYGQYYGYNAIRWGHFTDGGNTIEPPSYAGGA